MKQHPTRIAGLAALPTAAPDKAAAELQRPRARGLQGRRHQRPQSRPLSRRRILLADPGSAEALGAPIYLHPALPPKAVIEASYGGFSPPETFLIAGPGWGWHIETGMHVIRMMLRGVFDRYPKLQIVIGHMGEGLPFMLPRLERSGAGLPASKLKRSLGDYLRQNVHYTFGGFNFPATFQNLLAEVGIERIMFSVDYPYGSMAEALAFLKGLPISGADRERIAHKNAEALFKL